MRAKKLRQPDDDHARKVTRSLALYLLAIHGGHQDELARSAGISRRTVSRAVTGARAIRRSLLARLAIAAGVTPEDLDALVAVTERIHARWAGGPAVQTAARRTRDQGLKEAAAGLAEPLRAYLERRFDSAHP